jgi:hypothetical protein
MKQSPDREIERLLDSMTPKRAPEGLRERVLGAAARRRAADSATTPLLRICLAGCAVILIVVSMADKLASKNESSRFRTILGVAAPNHNTASQPAPEDDALDPLLAELKAAQLKLYADGKTARRDSRDLPSLRKSISMEEGHEF